MSALAVATAFTAGLATSVGPCVAPRYLALSAIAARATGRARWIRIGSFVAGLLTCYALLVATASLIGKLMAFSRSIYLALALGFVAFGLQALIVRRSCSHAARQRTSSTGALLSGTALGLVLSPCCSPVIAMLAAVSASSGSLAISVSCGLAFAAGHVAPLLTVGFGFSAVKRFAPVHAFSGAGTTISGGLALALAAFYGLLA
jgi:cytochrome c-type biogenesis protein